MTTNAQGSTPTLDSDPAVASLWTTLIKIADYLEIDPEAARSAPGKPSDVYIAHIQAKLRGLKAQVNVLETVLRCIAKESEDRSSAQVAQFAVAELERLRHPQ